MKDLKTTRKDFGINQRFMAEKIGLTPAAYNLIENGKAVPRATTQATIEQVLKKRVNWLSTSGLTTVGTNGEVDGWTMAEQNLRKALKDIKTLQGKPERAKYIQMVRHYATVLENEFINQKTITL